MWIKKFLYKFALCFVLTTMPLAGVHAATNLPDAADGNIGDYGTWATEENRETITTNLSKDVEFFQSGFQKQLVSDYVPIEAKIGIAFINGMAYIGHILDTSLVRFITIFIGIMFMFWMGFEAYQMITGTTDVRKSIKEILKKGFMISIWLIIINMGAARLFMLIMGPILSLGSYLTDLILNAVTSAIGVPIPDTCGAIRSYASTQISANALIDANAASELICLPTRLSGFFYTAMAAGWKWAMFGIGHSVLAFLAGIALIVIFFINIWKFMLMALGVIADLFLSLFMLPFTAVSETIGKTSYKGIAGTIFNGFLGLIKAESLGAQIARFINAALFFVSLSIVIAVCAALMYGVIDINLASEVPDMTNYGWMTTILIGLLVAYLANKAQSIAKDLGGSIDDSFGKKIGQDTVTLAKDIQKQSKKYWKIYKDSKKSS